MARFVVTNRVDVFDAILGRWRSAGLDWIELPGSLFAAAAHKRRITHTNTSIADERSWVVGTGVYATFDGRWEDSALAAVADSIDPAEPLRVRNELFGHYGLVVRRGDRAFVMCDEVCSYELFVTERGGDFAVATALADLTVVDWTDGPIEVDAALRAAFHGHRGLVEHSVLPGVRALRGHQFVDLHETPDGWTCRVVDGAPVAWRPRPATAALGVEEYNAATERIFHALRSGPEFGVNATGGMESRLLVAAAHRFGGASCLLYGRGNSAMTNTKRQDLAIAQTLSTHTNLPLTVMDWRQDRPWSADQRAELRSRFGFALPYGATAGLIETMESSETMPPLQLGGYSPGFSNKKVWAWTEDVDPVEFARRCAAHYLDVFRTPTDRDRYVRQLADDMETLAEQLAIPRRNGRFDVAASVALFGFVYVGRDGINTNAFNEWDFFLAPHLTSELLLRLLAAPPEWRSGELYELELIRALDREALSIPIYSATKPVRIGGDGELVAVDPRREWPLQQLVVEKVRDIAHSDAVRTRRFRRALLDDLRRVADDTIDPEQMMHKDMRAVSRFITAREMV